MWWIALVAAVGAALLAGCLGCGVFLLWRRKYGHGRKGGAQGAADQASMIWPTQRDLTWACSRLSLYSSGGYLQSAYSKRASGVPCVLQNMLRRQE